MGSNLPPHQPGIPDKLYFRIGEVSALAGVPASVLRFWETEFSGIRPKRTAAGQRLYRKKDVLLVLEIKHLLYERKFTIQGARQHLKTTGRESPRPAADILVEIRSTLEDIRRLLDP